MDPTSTTILSRTCLRDGLTFHSGHYEGPAPPSRDGLTAGGWEEAEAILEVTLPVDYKEFIETYGVVAIGNELGLPDYRLPDHRYSWFDHQPGPGRFDVYPLPIYPADGPALFQLVANQSAQQLYGIVTDGSISDELLWIGNFRASDWTQSEGPLNHFLTELLLGHLHEIYEVMDADLWKLPSFVTPVNG